MRPVWRIFLLAADGGVLTLFSTVFAEMEVHQIERVLKAFEKFDKDGDGVLDAGEPIIVWPIVVWPTRVC
jgi:hypothetical protein